MNLNKILSDIGNATPEAFEQKGGRREVIMSLGKKMALAAVPFAISSLFEKASAQTTTVTMQEAVTFLLNLEYLQYSLYHQANAIAGFIPAAQVTPFQKLEAQAQQHVGFLQTTLTGLGANYPDMPIFDFTTVNTNNIFGNVFADYQTTFLEVAQAFEDMAVRSYKGHLLTVRSNRDLLTSLMQMQTTEARHASHIRQLRNITPWIDANASGIYSKFLQPAYNGENQTSQLNILLVNINGQAIDASAAEQSFDEPVDMGYIIPIINTFIAP